ncbi:MAG: tetratricopeptide repeat protein [Micromonosporaceae bacterium]|nr:tetratricopeptide repeat protein [Micromonosporaceae bacterium]
MAVADDVPQPGRGGRGWWLVGGFGFVFLLAVVVNLLLQAGDEQLGRLDQTASVVSGLLAIVSFPATAVSLVVAIRARPSAVEPRPGSAGSPTGEAGVPGLGRALVVRDGAAVQVDDHTHSSLSLDATAMLPSVESVAAPVGLHNLPLTSAVFVGRDIGVLDGLLTDGRGVIGQAVHGLGGVGKTALAVRYARKYLGRYRLVWWITAETRTRVDDGLAELTGRLHPMPTLAEGTAWAVTWLQAQPGWLLVLDNVENPADVDGLLGLLAGRGDVLITTRRDVGTGGWAKLGLRPLRLEVLDRGASVDLLCQLTGLGDRRAADRLAGELGDLPLALEQAGTYISQHHGLAFDAYRQLLTRRFATIADAPGEGGDAERTIRRVWTVTMATVSERSPLAARLLSVLACLAPDDLPEDVLSPLTDDPVDAGEALALLASYSMITRCAGMVSIHRLVQSVTRAAEVIPDSGIPAAVDDATGLLFTAIPADPDTNPAGWSRWAVLLPHIDEVAKHLPHDHHTTRYLSVLDQAAAYLLGQGQLTRAITLYEQTLTDRRRVLGDDHPLTKAVGENLRRARGA